MFTYAVVHGVNGLSNGVQRRLEQSYRSALVDHLLTFPVAERLLWFDPGGSTAIIGWWSGLDELGGGRPWIELDDAVTAYSGQVWPRGRGWDGTGPWAEQLHRLLSTAVGHDDHGLSGVFSAVHLDGAGGGLLTSDPLGFSLVYRATAGDVTVYGNRSPVCAHLLTGRVERDPVAAGWLAHTGDYVADVTPIKGVDVVSIGTRVEIGGGSPAEAATAHPTTWFDEPLTIDEAVDLILDELVAELRVMAASSAQPKVADLTGGKDSRLILAGLIAAGLTDRFVFSTVGGAGTHDVIISDELVSSFGLERGSAPVIDRIDVDRWRPPGRGSYENYLDRLHRQYSFCSGGGGNGTYSRTVAVPSAGVNLNGLGGELLRTYYTGTGHLTHHDQIPTFLNRGLKIGVAELIRRDQLERYEDSLASILEVCRRAGDAPQDTIDRFYLHARLRRWGGTNHEFHRTSRLFPLMNPKMLAAAFAVGQRARRAELLFFRVMQRVDPRLVTTPFAQSRWPATLRDMIDDDDLDEGLFDTSAGPQRHRAQKAGRKPKQKPKQSIVRTRRARQAAGEADLFDRYLAREPDNPVYEVVDRSAVLAALDQLDSLPVQSRYQLMGTMSAAIWVGEHELAVVPE